MNGQRPSYLSERFNVLNVDYDLRGGGSRLKLPPFNLECLHKSFSYICASLWNGIPVMAFYLVNNLGIFFCIFF